MWPGRLVEAGGRVIQGSDFNINEFRVGACLVGHIYTVLLLCGYGLAAKSMPPHPDREADNPSRST